MKIEWNKTFFSPHRFIFVNRRLFHVDVDESFTMESNESECYHVSFTKTIKNEMNKMLLNEKALFFI